MTAGNRILQGDALAHLRRLPDESVDCVMTSPPYWGLRDYGVRGQFGLEPTLEEYLDNLLLVTAELHRVLKDTGTMFWNHGDKYGGAHRCGDREGADARRSANAAAKSLSLQAHRLAIRMVGEQGWILRNVVIWHKPNAMPSSVKDRFGVDYDSVFFFTKSKRYFFEPQFEKTTAKSWSPFNLRVRDAKRGLKKSAQYRASAKEIEKYRGANTAPSAERTKRCVWTVPSAPFPEAHFATFPEKLVETPLRAGCPERVCAKCGAPWLRIVRKTPVNVRPHAPHEGKARGADDGDHTDYYQGYADCGCNAGWRPGVVLDPFFGAGTTGLVALRLSRHFIGIELNPAYVAIAGRRIRRFLADRNVIPLPSDGGMADGGLREAA